MGLLWGTAVGDALGLPAEGLSPRTIQRRWPQPWRHRLLFGRGMTSDDTEHTFLVGQSLVQSGSDTKRFQSLCAARLRWWFAALPGGVGLATARACAKLWLGFSPARSGVNSAGNGPAMRAAIIGAYHSDNAQRRLEFVAVSSRITHTDERAVIAAQAVAEAAALIVNGRNNSADLLERMEALSQRADWREVCSQLKSGWESNHSVGEMAAALGLKDGVSGYALHTVPIALFAVWRSPGNFRDTLTRALDCGGDTDSVGAIVGGLAGLRAELNGIPSEWIAGVIEWPRTGHVMGQLAERMVEAKENGAVKPVTWFWPGVPLRNVFFILVVILHGFRRLVFNIVGR
jgi:ADP-ribosyl-[dinitrogen reductase] hydrolase